MTTIWFEFKKPLLPELTEFYQDCFISKLPRHKSKCLPYYWQLACNIYRQQDWSGHSQSPITSFLITLSRNLLLLPPIITDYQSYLSISYLSILWFYPPCIHIRPGPCEQEPVFLARNCLRTNQHKYLGSERYMAISSLVVAFPSLAHILQSSSITPLQYPPRYFTSDDDDDDDDTYIAAIFHTYSPISTQIFHIWHFTNLER